ncbi:MAG: hypothetical protein WC592_04305 [Candidatus Omnitrophota bacterium]|nr:hypothetical protein [Candidatus Omnitrophota bacterium]
MSKKVFVVFVAISFCAVGIFGLACAAEQKAPAAKPAKTAVPSPKVPVFPTKANVPPIKSTFGMITGTLVKVNSTDPANTTLEVKNDADQTTHVVSLTPWTNVTKVTDVSELKTGDMVRVMTRKMDDKEVAMGVMFGKIKPIPRPKPAAAAPAAPAAAPVKAR